MELEFTLEANTFIQLLCDEYGLTPELVIQKGLSMLQAYIVGKDRGDTWTSTTKRGTISNIIVPGIG